MGKKTKLVEELKEILAEDFYALTDEGTEIESQQSKGSFKTVQSNSKGSGRWNEIFEVVTELPDGRFFQWRWEQGLTEYQDDLGPGEYGEVELTEVFHSQRTIIVDEYKPQKNG